MFGYLDLVSAQTKLAFRMPFRYLATPTATVTILRGYPDNTHAVTMWSLNILTSNRVQFLEQGGVNITSPAGSPLTPGSDYVCQGLIDIDGMNVDIDIYPRTSTSPTLSMNDLLTVATATQSVRFGIGTASALTQLDTNCALAIGSGDFLARTDVANTPPSAGVDQTVDAYTLVTLSATDAESAVTWTQTGGSPSVTLGGSGNVRTFTAPAVRAGTTLTFTATDAGALTDTCSVVVYPHNEYAVIGGVEVPIQIVQV